MIGSSVSFEETTAFPFIILRLKIVCFGDLSPPFETDAIREQMFPEKFRSA